MNIFTAKCASDILHMQILEVRRRKLPWKRVPDSHPHVDRGICRQGDKGRNWIPIQNSPQKDELLRRLSAADSLTPMSLLRRRKLEPSSLIRLHPKVQAFIRRPLNRRARLPCPAAATLMFLINGIEDGIAGKAPHQGSKLPGASVGRLQLTEPNIQEEEEEERQFSMSGLKQGLAFPQTTGCEGGVLKVGLGPVTF